MDGSRYKTPNRPASRRCVFVFKRPLPENAHLPLIHHVFPAVDGRAILEGGGAGEAEVRDGLVDVAVVHLAGTRLVPAWNVADVEMANVLDVLADVGDEVAFHDLIV